MVDEATGYQEDKNRAKDELQKFLNQFLTEEASKWVKIFNDSFFEMIYKMRDGIGRIYIRDPLLLVSGSMILFIEDLDREFLKNLKQGNPKNDKGHKSKKDHQFLSEDLGKPQN